MRIQSHILGEQSQSQYPKSEACGFSATYLKARGQYRPLQAFEPSKRLQIPVPTTYDTLVYRNLSPTSPCTYPYPYLLSIYPSIHPSICIMYIYNSLYIYTYIKLYIYVIYFVYPWVSPLASECSSRGVKQDCPTSVSYMSVMSYIIYIVGDITVCETMKPVSQRGKLPNQG